MSKSALRVMHENDVKTYKKWLRETLPPINVERGLSEILFNLNPLYSLKKMQIIHLGDTLARNMRFARSSFSFEDSYLKLDEIITLIPNQSESVGLKRWKESLIRSVEARAI